MQCKVSTITKMQQMTETRAWKHKRENALDTDRCRMCGDASGIMNLTSGCKVLAA